MENFCYDEFMAHFVNRCNQLSGGHLPAVSSTDISLFRYDYVVVTQAVALLGLPQSLLAQLVTDEIAWSGNEVLVHLFGDALGYFAIVSGAVGQ